MRFIVLHLFVICLSICVFAQEDGKSTVAQNGETPEVKVLPDTDKEAFEKASALEEPQARIDAFEMFLSEFPDSAFRPQVVEFLTAARAVAAEVKLREGENAEAIRLFRIAIEQSPKPVPDDIFSKILVNIPAFLFLENERDAAFEMADILEVRAAENHRQMLRLATFYVGIKYATGVRRLAEKAILIEPTDPIGFQTLALAHRLGFNLKGAEEAYRDALKVSPESAVIKQGLAEMKRARGDFQEAESIFREIIEADPGFEPARTGLILCLFDLGKRSEAEALLLKEAENNKANTFLLAGAAYWYAVNDEPDIALEYGQAAIEAEISDPWAYVAMSRAFMKKGDPLNAERYLLTAASYSLSSTLSFEIALARASAGFYREAAEILRSRFFVENGKLVTELDGRIGVEAENLRDLIALERKASIFEPAGNYQESDDGELSALLKFEETLARENATDEEIKEAADRFTSIPDRMKTHRRLYIASRLLDAGKLAGLAGRLSLDSVGEIESSLDVLVPSAAVMADHLYESRMSAAKDGRYIVTPRVERSTLEKIMRGRIEELAARAQLAEGDVDGAEVRLKRAISVLPKDSAWWRSSLWFLGDIYAKKGENQKALEQYRASYMSGDATVDKRVTIEIVYIRLNGSIEGLDEYLSKTKTVTPDAASMFTKKKPEEAVSGPEAVIETKEASTETSETIPEERKELFGLPNDLFATPVETDKKVLKEDIDLSLGEKVNTEETVTLRPVEIKKPAETVPEQIKDAADSSEKSKVNLTNLQPAPAVPPVSDETAKTGNVDESLSDEDIADAVVPDEQTETKPADKPETPADKPDASKAAREAELIDLGARRPRIVPPEKVRPANSDSAAVSGCSVVLSQERVSIFANGGSFGVVVGVDNYDEAYVLRAVTASPEDVTITHEPEIGSLDGRAFFVIKSVSENKGEFLVSFETPCGTRSVTVDVH